MGRRTFAVRHSRRAPWPILLSFFFVATALCMQSVAMLFDRQAAVVVSQMTSVLQSRGTDVDLDATPDDPFAALPDDGDFSRDMARFFRIARDHDIKLGGIDYRHEANPKLPRLILRSVEFRVNDDYPTMKSFVAHVLELLPHAALQEMRVEKKDAVNAEGAFLVRLVFLYGAKAPSRI